MSNTEWNVAATDGDVPTDIIKNKTGFTFNEKKSTMDQKIAANASTIVKLYYDRTKYNLTFSYGIDGKKDLVSQVKYGAEISAPGMHTDGYTFKDWDKTVASTMPAADTTYTAVWTANTDTAYKVEHYKQGVVGGSFTLVDTDHMTGTTDSLTEAKAKSYDGYTAEKIKQQNIKADGTTVIRILYDLNPYTITYDGLDDSDTVERTNTFTVNGTSFTLTAPEKKGYTFTKWTCDNDKVTIGSDGLVTIPANITGSIKITANWTQNPVKLLDPNGNDSSILAANTPLGYTISYENGGESVTDSIVAYWIDNSTGKHYCDGGIVEAGVETLQAVLMNDDVPMEINSEDQLIVIASQVSKSSAAWAAGNYKLVGVVLLTDAWTGIGTVGGNAFTGTFDGGNSSNNSSSAGCMIVYNGAKHSLFNYASGAAIKNITINGSLVSADKYVGGIAAYADENSNISNCIAPGGQIIANGNETSYVGSIVGYAIGSETESSSESISKCIVQNMSITCSSAAGGYAGGIAGYLERSIVNSDSSSPVYNCNITAKYESGNVDVWAGGAVGAASDSNFTNVHIASCTIETASARKACSGGIVGEIVISRGGSYEFLNCLVEGGGTATGCNAQTSGDSADSAAYSAGVAGRAVFSSDNISQLKISELIINGAAFAAKSTSSSAEASAAAGSVIGEMIASGNAACNVQITWQAINANVTENEIAATDLVGVIPEDATKEENSSTGVVSITCPAKTSSGIVVE